MKSFLGRFLSSFGKCRAVWAGGLSAMALTCASWQPAQVLAQPAYGITAIGLFNAEHTSLSGRRYSELYDFSTRTQLLGRSQRFNGDTAHGWTTWMYVDAELRVMGLRNAEHTRDDGYRSSSVLGSLRPGYVYGESERYFGSVRNGTSAWVHEGAISTQIGFFDADHTSGSGFRNTSTSTFDLFGNLYGSSNNFYSSAQSGRSLWKFLNGVTEAIGLIDSSHIRDDGFRSGRILRVLRGSNSVVGTSRRFTASGEDGGNSIWHHGDSGSKNIGLTDAEHTSASDRRSAQFRDSSSNGLLGVSQRFSGDTDRGQSAWWYRDNSSQKIGLTDAAHTRADGYQWNEALGFTNNRGDLAFGIAHQFVAGTSDVGQHAWLSDRQSTTILSPTDGEHTRNDGLQHSTVAKSGKTIYGHAQRFDGGNTNLGQSAWIWNNNAVEYVGLKNATHTRANGFQSSEIEFVTKSGIVVGSSDRFNNTTANRGVSAWIHQNGTSTNISMTGSEFTALSGTRRSVATHVTESGFVAGTATRYLGTNDVKGQGVWFYNGVESRAIGLQGASHTDSDGTQMNFLGDRFGNYSPISSNGMVRGQATRYDGAGGQSTWLYNGTDTREIGLIGIRYTRADNYRFSEFTVADSNVNPMNSQGQVIGYSTRFGLGTQSLGQTAWLYDPTSDTTTGFDLSQRSDGRSNSAIQYFDNNGLVLGWYEHFGINDEELGRRAFLYSQADGLHALGDLITGGLTSAGWQNLAQVVQANGFQRIVGYGLMQDMTSGQVVFVLNQQTTRFAIPEPTLLPAVLAVAACGWMRRRRNSV